MRYDHSTLGEICNFIDYRGKTPEKTTSGIPLITAKIIKNGFIQPPEEFIATDAYDKWMRRGIPKRGSVIMTTEAPLGEVARIDTDDKLAFAQRIIILEPDETKLDSQYLYYAMRDSVLMGRIKERATGTTVTGIKAAELRKVIIDYPSLQTQRQIAVMLGCIDQKIQNNTRINDNLLQQARALFQHWVSNTPTILYKLSEVADINPETYSPKENWSFVNYLDTSSITSGRISDIQYIIPSEEKLPSRARRIIRENDVVFSTVRPNQLHYGIIPLPKPNMLGSTGFVVIRSKKDRIPNEIIYLAITEPTFVEQMQQLAEQSVSTFPSIRPNDLDACIIPEPREEDADFVSLVKSIFKIVTENNEENERLSALRDSLLPRLMSGEIDVSSVTI